ncbi:MAG: hypothetical protein KDB90_02845 [Planctomycetes bacterium]|nr:hypothetical protein [Planctomycetota bacterium]
MQPPNGPQHPQWAARPGYQPGAGPQPAPQFGPPGFAPGPAYYQPPPRKRRTWLIVLLVLGIPVGLLVAFIALGFAFLAMADEKPATEADKQLVLTVTALEPYIADYTADPARGTFTRRDNIDGSWEVEYEYEDDELYIMSGYYRENSADDAKYTVTGHGLGTSIGFSGEDIKEVEHNELFRWGDDSKFYLVMHAGKPIGNHLTARKGNKVVYILFSGVYFDDSELLHEFLDPLLQRVDASK